MYVYYTLLLTVTALSLIYILYRSPSTHSKPSQSVISFHTHCLVAASNGDSSASTLNGSWLTDCPQQSSTLLPQHSHSWFQAPSGMAIFLFFPKYLWVLKWGLLFIERKDWSFCDYSEYRSNLLLAFASKVIFGFGSHRSLS